MTADRRLPDELLNQAMQWVSDAARVHTISTGVIVSTSLGLALIAGWALVYATNGTSSPFPHVMYLPIIVASLTLGVLGGALTAIAAGLLMGTLMPLNVELGIAQPPENTLYRAGFFLLVAIVSGGMAESSRRRYAQLQQAKTDVSEISSRNLRLFARLVAERDEQTSNEP
jgi:hypothetical protein